MNTGERIEELLTRKGINHRELSLMVGVTEQSISRYVHGTRVPRGNTLAKIAKALNVTSDYLLGCETEEDPMEVFNKVLRYADRYAGNWRSTQKIALVAALFTAKEEG